MTRKQRRILFWASVVFFALAVVPILLYSFGYRFSWQEFKIVRAGGLVASSVPSTGTKIFINGKLEKETSLLSRTLFLQGLTPHIYTIRIEKDGYFTWKKKLPVLPERVTETRALLVKKNPDNNIILLRGDFKALDFTYKQNNILTLIDSRKGKRYYSIPENTLVPEPKTKTATSSSDFPDAVSALLAEKKPMGSDYDAPGDRVLWWQKNRIWVRWLRGEEFLPLYTDNPEAMIFDGNYPIREAYFYPAQDALFAAYANEIDVIELDGRGKRNIYPLYKGKEPQFEVSGDEKKVYILDDGNLISLPFS